MFRPRTAPPENPDAAAAEQQEDGNGTRYDFLCAAEDGFRKHRPKALSDLAAGFAEYKS